MDARKERRFQIRLQFPHLWNAGIGAEENTSTTSTSVERGEGWRGGIEWKVPERVI